MLLPQLPVAQPVGGKMAPHCRPEGSFRSAGGAADEEPPSPSWSILRFVAPRSILWRVLLVPCAVCGAAGSMASRMSVGRRSSHSAGWGKESVEGEGGVTEGEKKVCKSCSVPT